MGKPEAPTPPDPKDTASAATGTNIGTAIANNAMGMVNQTTPFGSLNYEQTGTYAYTDPYTGQTYDLPQYSATTSLSPEQQNILNQQYAAKGNLASAAAAESANLGNPAQLTDQIDAKLYELGAKRLDPRFAAEEDALRTRLANQGITMGSEAYNRELDRFGQGKNDAYNQLLLGGRGQALNEINAPVNRIAAMLGGSQVQQPNVSMVQPGGAATTDVAGLINNAYTQQYQNYSNKMAQQQSLLGGLFGLGAKAITGGLF